MVDVADQLQRPRQQRPARQRRRGEELEAALLEAAWEELAEAGFAKLTMESVATRAQTGIAVLYRRWSNKDDLVIAAIRHYGRTRPVGVPDTGSLRGDMIALMGAVSEARHTFTAVIPAVFAGLLADSGMTPMEARDKIIGGRPLWSHEIFRRAHERGEINLEKIPPAVLTMPFDLMRHDLLLTLKPAPDKRILEIVDDLFLPLVRLTAADGASALSVRRGRGRERGVSSGSSCCRPGPGGLEPAPVPGGDTGLETGGHA
jgi:AcrR family transcriptional regulator